MSETPVHRPLRGRPTVLSSRDAEQPLTEAEGRQALVRFVTGDRSPLDRLTPMPAKDPVLAHAREATAPPHGADPLVQAREFGLIVEHGTDEAHVVVGEKGMVEWAPVLDGGRCVAHVHPLITATPRDRRAGPRWADRAGQVTRFAAVVGKPSQYGTYLPTTGDLGFTIARGLDCHTVYTPYRLVGAGAERTLCAPESAPDAPLLSWEIRDASETDVAYDGLLVGLADHVPFWSSRFAADRQKATEVPFASFYTLGTPDHYL